MGASNKGDACSLFVTGIESALDILEKSTPEGVVASGCVNFILRALRRIDFRAVHVCANFVVGDRVSVVDRSSVCGEGQSFVNTPVEPTKYVKGLCGLTFAASSSGALLGATAVLGPWGILCGIVDSPPLSKVAVVLPLVATGIGIGGDASSKTDEKSRRVGVIGLVAKSMRLRDRLSIRGVKGSGTCPCSFW